MVSYRVILYVATSSPHHCTLHEITYHLVHSGRALLIGVKGEELEVYSADKVSDARQTFLFTEGR